MVYSFLMSFTNWDMLSDFSEVKFLGLENYVNAFKDKYFIDSLANNSYLLLSVPLQMLIALVLAIIVNDTNIRGRNLTRAMIFSPYVTSIVAISLIWFQLLHPTEGVINNFLTSIGITNPPLWFASSNWVKPALILMITWQKTGYDMILYLAGLQSIPKALYEASEVDGITGFKKFFHITLPLISPVSFLIMIMSVIESFKMWTNIQILTDGGPGTSSMVLGYYIYKNAFVYSKTGYAASIAWVLFMIIMIITMIQWVGQKKWVSYIQ